MITKHQISASMPTSYCCTSKLMSRSGPRAQNATLCLRRPPQYLRTTNRQHPFRAYRHLGNAPAVRHQRQPTAGGMMGSAGWMEDVPDQPSGSNPRAVDLPVTSARTDTPLPPVEPSGTPPGGTKGPNGLKLSDGGWRSQA